MGSLSLGRPKWGGSTWVKRGHEGEAPWGSFQEASPLPLGAALGRRDPPSSKEDPLPLRL